MALYLGETSLGGGAGGGGGIDGGIAVPVTVVSGGGGGYSNGSYAGGGGGGGYMTKACQFLKGVTYDITVGAGGAVGANGDISSVSTAVGYFSLPGGGKGGYNGNSGAGSCDGGSGNSTSTRRLHQGTSQVFGIHTPTPTARIDTSTIRQGHGIHVGPADISNHCERYASEGGNGMGGRATQSIYNGAREGGNGILSKVISATFATDNNIGEVTNGEVYFCGGGNGGTSTLPTYPGGGGNGSGLANSGGGGRGHGAGGAGGSGVVMIQAKEDTDITTTGTVVTETANGIKTYCFKTSGTITFN